MLVSWLGVVVVKIGIGAILECGLLILEHSSLLGVLYKWHKMGDYRHV